MGVIAELRKMLFARAFPGNGRCLRASGKYEHYEKLSKETYQPTNQLSQNKMG